LPPLDITGLTLFIGVLFIGLYANLFGLPGTALIFLDVLVYASVTGFYSIGKPLLISLLVLALLAEGLELILCVIGASRFSVSKKGFFVSFLGSSVGALLLTPWLYGLGTLGGIFLGGFSGILLTELIRQMHLRPALRDTRGALLGRAAGTLAKGSLALVMVVLTLMSIYS
jgi:uncharacterized protein